MNRILVLCFVFISGIVVGTTITKERFGHSPSNEIDDNKLLQKDNIAADLKRILKPESTKNLSNPKEGMVSNSKSLGTKRKASSKEIYALQAEFIDAINDGDINKQNRIFEQMVSADPKHELVFKIRAESLQDANDWKGAQTELKNCVVVNPESLFCHQRLANIRSSSNKEKIIYGLKCLELSEDNIYCMIDLALALSADKQHSRANEYFEEIFRTTHDYPYEKSTLLFQYASNLEALKLFPEAFEAFNQACKLKMKPACNKADKLKL